MAPATDFFYYWALAFGSLCVALVLLSIFYHLIDSDLDLHSVRKEALIAGVASAVQGAGFWFSTSLFPGQPFRRLVIPCAIVAIIYWLSHLEDWSGYEVSGIAFFQAAILSTGLCLVSGQFKLAVIVCGAFILGVAVIASIAKSL
jgi:hypothetical protein